MKNVAIACLRQAGKIRDYGMVFLGKQFGHCRLKQFIQFFIAGIRLLGIKSIFKALV